MQADNFSVQDVKEGRVALVETTPAKTKKVKKGKQEDTDVRFARILSKEEAIKKLPEPVKKKRIREIDEQLASSQDWPQSQHTLRQNIPEELSSTPPEETNLVNKELESSRFFHSVMSAPDSLSAQLRMAEQSGQTDRADRLNRQIQETLPPWQREQLKSEKAALRSSAKKVNRSSNEIPMVKQERRQEIPAQESDSESSWSSNSELESVVFHSRRNKSKSGEVTATGDHPKRDSAKEQESEVDILVKHIEHLQERLKKAEGYSKSRKKIDKERKRKLKNLLKKVALPKTKKTSKGKVSFKKKYAKRSEAVRRMSIETLALLDVQDPEKFYHENSDQMLQAIINFRLAAEDAKLPVCWGRDQMKVFLNRLHDMNYVASTLRRQWSCWCRLANTLNESITEEEMDAYDMVVSNCRETKDNKVPVSAKLLKQLLRAADATFKKYNAALFKAICLIAFGASMRVGEYTQTQAKTSHNIRHDAISLERAGIEVEFYSDKTAGLDGVVKHRFIPWSLLPKGAKVILHEYDSIRPVEAPTYFCQIDGRPLTRKRFVDWLETCLLQTEYRRLHVVPHSLRLGGTSV